MLLVLACLLVACATAACSGSGHADATASRDGSGPRALTTDEANRLAVARVNAYRAKMLSVSGTVVSATGSITLRGWIDTVEHSGYGLVRPDGGTGFLTVWNSTEVSAQNYTGTSAPLPRPATGWSTMHLKAGDSALAAAQLVLLGLSSDRPDNPQLLLQSGATWLRSDSVDGVPVDVMSGPLATGATVSNLRYWVDHKGNLRRIQARLDGRDWSSFDLAAASGTTFAPPPPPDSTK